MTALLTALLDAWPLLVAAAVCFMAMFSFAWRSK